MKLEVILPLAQIPDQSLVRKVTGQKAYLLRKDLKIWNDLNKSGISGPILRLEPGCVILFDRETGGLVAVPESKKMVWFTSFEELDRLFGSHQ